MIEAALRRAVLTLAAASALAASLGVFVIALAYALFALVRPSLGSAGASAVVAALAALLAGLVAAILFQAARPRRRDDYDDLPAPSLSDRALGLAAERPLLTAGAAIGVGLLALRNPRYLGSAIRSFADLRGPSRRW